MTGYVQRDYESWLREQRDHLARAMHRIRFLAAPDSHIHVIATQTLFEVGIPEPPPPEDVPPELAPVQLLLDRITPYCREMYSDSFMEAYDAVQQWLRDQGRQAREGRDRRWRDEWRKEHKGG